MKSVALFVLSFVVHGLAQTNNSTVDLSGAANSAGVNCQQSALLNALLLQALFQAQVATTQNPLIENLNRILRLNSNEVSPTSIKPNVRIFTSQQVSTVTQVLSTVLSVLFKNRRIPTTIYSSTVIEVTELKTITSTLGLEPTRTGRTKRQPDGNELIESSFGALDDPSLFVTGTPSISRSSSLWNISEDDLLDAFAQPQVQQAWDHFIHVFERAIQNRQQN